MGKLDGKVALITGGARGQGRSHAVTLAGEGADIAVCDIDAQIGTVPYELSEAGDLDETKRLVEAEGRRCLAAVADVRDGQAMKDLAGRAISELGKVDILVANAGIFMPSPVAELSEEMWRDMIDTNLTGVFNSMRAVLPHMAERGYGRIVATSSMFGLTGAPNSGHYAAAKWGIIGLTKTVAVEMAGSGITANAVCPTQVNTKMIHNEAAYETFRPDLENPSRDEAIEGMTQIDAIPVPWVEPEEVSRLVLFLVSDETPHITGESFAIDAGTTASAIG